MTSIACVSADRFVSGAEEKHLRVFDTPQSAVDLLLKFSNYVDKNSGGKRVGRAYLPALGLTNKGGDQGDGEEEGLENDAGDGAFNEGNFVSERDLGTATLFPEALKLFGHDNDILAVAASGSTVASACKARDVKEAAIRLWNVDSNSASSESAQNNTQNALLEGGHKSSVACLDFSQTGALLASSGKDRRLCVWNVAEKKLIAAVDNAHKRIVWSLSWGAGDVLISGGRDGCIKVWRLADSSNGSNGSSELLLERTVEFKGQAVTSVAWMSNSTTNVVAAGFESGAIKLVMYTDTDDPEKEKEREKEEEIVDVSSPHVATVKRLAWRPGRPSYSPQLASCGEDHAVKVFDIALS
jgi:elongator complex protein 2